MNLFSTSLAGVYAALILSAAGAQAQNLVKNGDFEAESTQTPPAGWLTWGPGDKIPANFTRDTTQARSGQASYRIHHPAGSAAYTVVDLVNNSIEVKKGKTYEFSFWAKTDVPGPANIVLFGLTSVNPIVNAPSPYAQAVPITTDWKQISFTVTEGADFDGGITKYLALSLNPTTYGPSAVEKSLWVDDVSVVEKQNGPTAESGIRLPAFFSDGVVLQRGIPIPIWGDAAPGQAVTVTLNGKKATATADGEGRWSLKLPAMEAGGPYDLQFQTGLPGAFAIKNILIGDVWIASGQSNMEFPLRTWSPADSEPARQAMVAIAAANDPQLRMFTVKRTLSKEPLRTVNGSWREANPRYAGEFSAVAYYFARELRREVKVPIGIIHSSWGGTPAQAWTKRDVLAADPDLKREVDNWDKTIANYPKAKAEFDIKLAAWQSEADKAKAEGRPEPPGKPREPLGPNSPYQPGVLYNGMIAPLLGYGIKGAIWYQGESNGTQGLLYRKLFPTMISNWRADWGQGDFPFHFVQLANFGKPQEQPVEPNGWAELREAQEMTLSLPNTGMAVTVDIGEPADVHPKNKAEVGRRLALTALAGVYGRKLDFSGPIYDSMAIEGNQIRLRFKYGQGLKVTGDKPLGFAIAGADKTFVWADAKVDGDTILVSSPQVPAPVAARYDWGNSPIGNLYNAAGLPASPFRTDK